MGRPAKPVGWIKNIHIIDHYAGFVSFVVETPWDGEVDCDIRGIRTWNKEEQQPNDLTYEEDFGLNWSIDRGQPIEEEIKCSEAGIEMLKKAAKKLAELCMKTNHAMQMKQYLCKHPNFKLVR